MGVQKTISMRLKANSLFCKCPSSYDSWFIATSPRPFVTVGQWHAEPMTVSPWEACLVNIALLADGGWPDVQLSLAMTVQEICGPWYLSCFISQQSVTPLSILLNYTSNAFRKWKATHQLVSLRVQNTSVKLNDLKKKTTQKIGLIIFIQWSIVFTPLSIW